MLAKHQSFVKAIKSDDLEKIEELLSEGFDVNYQNQDGYSVLHYAVTQNSCKIVKLLLAHENIKVDVKSKFCGYTPLHFVSYPSIEVNIEIVKMLIEKYPSEINSTDWNGDTPLLLSISKRNSDLIKYFVENGADVNHQNKSGETCLHRAAYKLYLDIIEYLLENTDIDPKIKDRKGKTALCLLLGNRLNQENQISICRKLTERTFKIDPSTQHYKFEDFFECTWLACRNIFSVQKIQTHNSTFNLGDYLIEKLYSRHNTKYDLIQRFKNSGCQLENNCVFALIHDQINKEIIQQNLGNLIDIFNVHEELLQKAIESDEMNVLVLELFEILNSIRFYDKYVAQISKRQKAGSSSTPCNIKVRQLGEWRKDYTYKTFYNVKNFMNDFADFFGYYMLYKVARLLSTESSYKRLYKIIKFFSRILDIDEVLVSFLHRSLQSKLEVETLNKVCSTLHPFTSQSGTIISMALSQATCQGVEIQQNVKEMLQSHKGVMNSQNCEINGVMNVSSLKHLCRYRIRKHLLKVSKSDRLKFFNKLDKLDLEASLPKSLVVYLKFDEIYGRFGERKLIESKICS